jgi:hypothetical protein
MWGLRVRCAYADLREMSASNSTYLSKELWSCPALVQSKYKRSVTKTFLEHYPYAGRILQFKSDLTHYNKTTNTCLFV